MLQDFYMRPEWGANFQDPVPSCLSHLLLLDLRGSSVALRFRRDTETLCDNWGLFFVILVCAPLVLDGRSG